MGCGGSSLPPDSPSQAQADAGKKKFNTPPPPKAPSSPVIPLYDDPFAFFSPSEKIFDNRQDRNGENTGLLSLMEGLASCRKSNGAAGQPPANEKSFPAPQETQKISDSQIDFFKMLDERIENGPDDESFMDSSGRVYSRSNSTVEGQRRWSASKITNPRTPTSPDDSKKFTFINARTGRSLSMKTPSSEDLPEEVEEEYSISTQRKKGPKLNLVSPTKSNTGDWSPSDEPVKEHYMFLGNLYTFTRPRIQTSNSPALVAVTPAVTEEDLHNMANSGELEGGIRCLENGGIKSCHNEKTLGGDSPDIENFWMDLEMTNEGKKVRENNVVKPKRGKSLPSDIVKGGILPLPAVHE